MLLQAKNHYVQFIRVFIIIIIIIILIIIIISINLIYCYASREMSYLGA